jgi:hypothetical protein
MKRIHKAIALLTVAAIAAAIAAPVYASCCKPVRVWLFG